MCTEHECKHLWPGSDLILPWSLAERSWLNADVRQMFLVSRTYPRYPLVASWRLTV
jgi:hypothetical protein